MPGRRATRSVHRSYTRVRHRLTTDRQTTHCENSRTHCNDWQNIDTVADAWVGKLAVPIQQWI